MQDDPAADSRDDKCNIKAGLTTRFCVSGIKIYSPKSCRYSGVKDRSAHMMSDGIHPHLSS